MRDLETRLRERLVELRQMREQLLAQLNAVAGAITEIEAALQEDSEEPSETVIL